MVKLGIISVTVGSFLLGIWLVKAGFEEMFVGAAALLSPKTAILIGSILLVFGWLRLKKHKVI